MRIILVTGGSGMLLVTQNLIFLDNIVYYNILCYFML